MAIRILFIPDSTGPVTHTTTGALTGQGSTVAGTAEHIAKHATSGGLTGQGAIVVGAASRTAIHPTSGSLTGQGAVIAGTAAHIAKHATSGALTGQGASIVGTASRTGAVVSHDATGALTGQGSIITGSATSQHGTIARPRADNSKGAWLPSTGSDLYPMLDEVTPDDADYIYATTGTTCNLALSAVDDPGTSSGQVVSYRAWSPTGDGVTVVFKQGATTIATWTHATLPTTATTYNQTLTAGECDAITDYTDLRVEFQSSV